MISVNWNSDKVFLFCAQFGCSAEDQMWVKGQYHTAMGWLVFPSMPKDTLYRSGDAHKHTHAREKRGGHTALAAG